MSAKQRTRTATRARNLQLVPEAPKPEGRCLNEQQLAWLRERHPSTFATAEAAVLAAQADTERSRRENTGQPV